MKVFLTGGTGFIGSQVLRRLLDEGVEVAALRRPGSRMLRPLAREPQWVEGDLETVPEAALRGCTALVHLAAAGVLAGQADWQTCLRWNVLASVGLWRRAREAGVERFLICGSCFEYGRAGERYERIPTTAPLEPTGSYHASKAAATMAAIAFAIEQKVRLLVLRPFHAFGEGESAGRLWPSLREAAQAGRDFPMTSGEQVRDFVPVDEVAAWFSRGLRSATPEPGRPAIYNVGTGVPRTLRAFAEEWWAHWGARGRLLPGVVPYRADEVMRYVPLVEKLD